MRTTLKMLSLLLLLLSGAAQAMAEDICIYLKITGNNGWATPTVWAWSDPGAVNCNVNGTWPGDVMEALGDNTYKWTAPAGKVPTNLLFSNGTNSEGGSADKTKTADLKFLNGATYIIDSPTNNSRPSSVKTEGGNQGGGETGGETGDDVDISLLPNYAPDCEFFYVNLGSYSWSDLRVWAWSSAIDCIPSEEGLVFPGRLMEPVKGFPGYYVWAINNGEVPDQIIISGNGQQKITGDETYRRGAIYNITGNSTGSFTVDTSHDYSKAPVLGGDTPASTALGAVQSCTETEHGVKFVCENGTLELTLYGDGVVKVLSSLNGQSQTERRSITVSASPENTFASITEDDAYYTLSTPQVVVKVAKASGLVGFYSNDNESSPLLAETSGFYNNAGSVKATFSAPDSKGFYGGGYFNTFNLINKSLSMNNHQTGGWPDNDGSFMHNICIPYVTADNGWGILFDNHYLNSTLKPGTRFTYSSSTPDAVAYYFVAGGNSRKVLENYTHLTGRQELPPYWALGYISSRYGYVNSADAENAIDGIKNLNIPLDGIVLDIFWQGDAKNAYGMGNLNWGGLFKDGPEMTRRFLNDKNVNTILITEPFFNNALATTQEMINKGFAADTHVDANSGMSWMCGGSGASLLDVTNPEANEWMWTYYKARTDEGVTGWWMDLGEPEGYDLNNDTKHKNGSPQQVQNEYGQLWSEGIYNAWKRDYPDRRPFFMPRSGTAGMQRFATFPWTGDIMRSWNGLAVQLPSLLNMSMAGVGYLGCDIGGFRANYNDENMYKRWMAFGCFSPMLRTHVDNYNNGACWAEPFYCTKEGQDQVRTLINMRYSYLPYIYTGAYLYTTQGTPLCRPLNFEGDTSLDNEVSGYFFGPDMIVAPVVNEAGSVSVTLPAAYGEDMERAQEWLDITDENARKTVNDIKLAGQTVNFSSVAYDKVPKLVRLGSIIPRYHKEKFSNTKELDEAEPICLEVYSKLDVDDVACGSMFEDDHVSATSLANGNYNNLKFEMRVGTHNFFTITCERENNGHEWSVDRPVIVHFPLRSDIYPEVRSEHVPMTRAADKVVTDHERKFNKSEFDAAKYAHYADETGYYIKTVWPKDAPSMRFYTFDSSITGIESIGGGDHNMTLSMSTTDGQLHVYFSADGGVDADVKVVDLAGRTVATTSVVTIEGTNHETFNLAPGIYIVNVNLPNASATGKALLR